MLKINAITFNYLDSPAGMMGCPYICWKLESDRRSVVQRTYRLRLALDAALQNCVYDSGVVLSGQSANLRPSVELDGLTRYYANVQVSDTYGERADITGTFITAYKRADLWTGKFVSVETEADKDLSFGTLLRKEFSVRAGVASAYFVGTAHGLYTAYLNGNKIGNDLLTPGWTSYNKHLLYQTYDITDALLQGANTVGISLGAGWYKGKMSYNLNRNHYGTRTAFGGCIVINYTDGHQEIINSDLTWKGARGPILFSEIYDGETYDARREMHGWNENGFDDSQWSSVSEVPQELSVLSPSQGNGIQIMQEIKPLRIFTTPEGDSVIDFGQNLSGWCRFDIRDAQNGDKAVLRFFETLDANGNVYTDNLRTAKQTITYTCAGGPATYQPSFTFQGFRYAHILQWPGEPSAEDFTALVLHTAMEETGSFSCSNPLLNQLQHNILWSMKGNSLDVPTDCPQRDERLGWTGDVQIFCSTATFLMNTYNFYAKWLTDVACDQAEDGAVAHVVPDIISGKSDEDWLTKQGCGGASAWADVDIILPWTLYLAYGNADIIRRQYPSMKKWVDFMIAHSQEGCLFDFKLQFGDWVALDAQEGSYFGATPTAYTCAAFYCHATKLFAKMAALIGEDRDAEFYGRLAQELRDSFAAHFVKEDGSLTVNTQTAQIVALYFDLVPEKYRAGIAAKLKQLLDENGGHLLTGFIGTPYFCHALSDNGYTQDAYSLMLKEDFPSWLYQVKKGATTVWEHWDGLKPDGTMWSPDMNSFNHYSYGSIGDWIYKNIGGLRPDEENPGYKHFSVRPCLDPRITDAAVCYDSIYGKIRCGWRRTGDCIDLEVTVPVNTSADIILDSAQKIIADDGVAFDQGQDAYHACVGSGTYHIRYVLK